MNEKKLSITSLGQVSNEMVFVPLRVKPATIAAATLIAHDSLHRVDMVYPNLLPTNSMKWEEIAYAHTVMTSAGSYYLLLVSESDLFGDSKGIFIELLDFPPKTNELGPVFTESLKKRIAAGLTACYQNDLAWL